MKLGNGHGPAAVAGIALVRVLVPVWVLSGALFKLFDGSPANLPVVVLRVVAALDLDPMLVLRFAIGFELALIGVIWLVPRLARPVASAILILFLLVLVGDMMLGASTCGCFGAVTVHPAVTFTIDALLLAGVLLLGGRAPGARDAAVPSGQAAAAVAWMIAAFAAAASASLARPVAVPAQPTRTPDAVASPAPAAPAPEAAPTAVGPVVDATATAGPARPAATPTAVPTPSPPPATAPAYYLPRYETWVGKPWSSLEIAAWVRGPVDTGPGTRYVMFYRLDCPHCHELMELHFAGQAPRPTTLIAVPERAGWPDARFDVPCTSCGRAELPPSDWLLATPVLVRLEDGVVACAAEVDPIQPECLIP